MSKEFHVFTDIQSTHEQAFVFEIDRDDESETIMLGELWLVTTHKNGELRTRVQLNGILDEIVKNKGGNIEENQVDTVIEMFEDILPEQKVLELKRDTMSESNSLLQASEIISGLSEESINEMLKYYKARGEY